MSALPPLAAVLESSPDKDGPLALALAMLFEPSPILYSELVPALITYIPTSPIRITTYSALIDAAQRAVSQWPASRKAQYIAGHPRIGEMKGLSQLSEKEQAATATPPEVLARLEHLNRCYERRYEGLRYITFVNGRSRAVIKDEMEGVLGLEPPENPNEPPLESISKVEIGGEEWTNELERAIVDVGRIAKSRLKALGVE